MTSTTAANAVYTWSNVTTINTSQNIGYTPVISYTPIVPPKPDTPEQWLRNRVKEICDLVKP